MPRYEQVSTLNINGSYIFAYEINPEAFHRNMRQNSNFSVDEGANELSSHYNS
jgi:hypothetical protein